MNTKLYFVYDHDADNLCRCQPEHYDLAQPRHIWGYGCPEHPGDPNAMSGKPSMCLAKRNAGSKGREARQICGRKLEPLRISGEERPSREALASGEREAKGEGGGDGS